MLAASVAREREARVMVASPAAFCRITIGDIEVTFVPDGYLCSVATNSYPGTDDAFWAGWPQHFDADGYMVMSLGTLLIRTADKTALVDLGWGPSSRYFGEPEPGRPSARMIGGSMLDNLRRVGVSPSDVDLVLFSHLHRDHTGWVADPASGSETPVFANAEHAMSRAEWEHWSTAPLEVGPAPTAEQLAVLGQRITFVEDGDTVLPGVDVVATTGHTPGHLSFVISSGAERALVLGDAVHCAVEISEPELEFVVDIDPEKAKATRRHIAQLLLADGTLAAAPHFNDLVFGRLLPGEGRPMWQFPESQRLSV